MRGNLGLGIAFAAAAAGLLATRTASAQTCTPERTLSGQYLNSQGAPGMRCETEAALRARATSVCKYTVGAVGTFRVESSGCVAPSYGGASFTCCPSPATPLARVPAQKRIPSLTPAPKRPAIAVSAAALRAPYVSPIFQKPLNAPGRPLRGYVDLHAHLMNHLGFGGRLLYGGTDVGVMMPAGSIWKPACPSDWVLDSPGLCFSKCPEGYRGVGPSCFPFCPPGWADSGVACTPPTYPRGVGYADPPSIYTRASKSRGNGYSWDGFAQRHNPEPRPGRNMSNGYDRCRHDLGEDACEEGLPGIYFPKCEAGWEGVGPMCVERCRAGYAQNGPTCSRSGIDIARERCAKDNAQGCDQVGLIFYPKCKAGYQTAGLICIQDCPATTSAVGPLCQKKLLARSGPQTVVKNCNPMNARAQDAADALGTCASTHGGWDAFNNTCGDAWRNFVIGTFASMADHVTTHDSPVREGTPTFTRWPKWNDIHHQQMWIEWVKRAYEGGLRVMVSLAGNSITLSKAIAGNVPFDDKSAGDVQLDEMQQYAIRNSSFVEIAKSAADLRRIVGQDKLAIVPGIELDHLGGFGNNTPDPSPDQLRAEIRRLYGKGARYVLPIHAADNSLGGTALYESMFLFANLFQTGHQVAAVCAAPSENIGKRLNTGDLDWVFAITGALGVQRFPQNCPVNIGFKNARGLQPLGKVALDEMMTLGMFIDVDHSGQNTSSDIIAYTNPSGGTASTRLSAVGMAYPLLTGHSGPRPNVSSADSSERSLPEADYRSFVGRGSIAGVGSDSAEAGYWIDSARAVMSLGMPIAFGSDVNGMANLPRPPWVNGPDTEPLLTAPPHACLKANSTGTPARCIEYLNNDGTKSPGSSATFKRATSGGRTWDYNTDGVAHFGLFPDFLRDVERRGGTDVVSAMYDGAEKFAVAWEKIDAIAARLRTTK